MDTSVSAVVKRLLAEYAADESEFDRLAREEKALREKVRNFSAAGRLTRDEIYDRRR